MRSIGYIKSIAADRGYGYIRTHSVEEDSRRSVDVYFQLSWWQCDIKPEVMMPVVFSRAQKSNGREIARYIKPLTCSENNARLAILQAEKYGQIAIYDNFQGKMIFRDVVQAVLEKMNDSDKDLVRRAILMVMEEWRKTGKTCIENLSRNNNVKQALLMLCNASCDDANAAGLKEFQRMLECKYGQKHMPINYLGVIKWFSQAKESSGQGYIVTNRHGFGDLKYAQGDLIEPKFVGASWLEKDSLPRRGDIVVFERGGREGTLAKNVRRLSVSAQDVGIVFQYLPNDVKIEGCAYNSPTRYNVDLLYEAVHGVLFRQDDVLARQILGQALDSLPKEKQESVCETLAADSAMALRLRTLYFPAKGDSIETGGSTAVIKRVLLAHEMETMKNAQEQFLEGSRLKWFIALPSHDAVRLSRNG